MEHNEVTNFMYYMYNKWSKDEAIRLFGNNLGNHIFGKWVWKGENTHDQTMSFYSELDSSCRQKLVDRANEIYGK